MITGNDASSVGQRITNSIFGVIGVVLDAASIASLGAGFVPETLRKSNSNNSKNGEKRRKNSNNDHRCCSTNRKNCRKKKKDGKLCEKVFEMLSGGSDKIAKYGTYAGTAVITGGMGISFESNFGSFDPEDLDPDLQPEDSE